MAYMHGIRIQENPTNIPEPVKNETGVPVIFGTAPVNMANDPNNAANTLFLCNTFAEAKAAVGYSDDYERYTLCQAMDAFFKIFGVGPVILCNVLDPNVHKKEYEKEMELIDGQAVIEEAGIFTVGLVVKNGENILNADTDYTITYNETGYMVLTVLDAAVKTVKVEGSQADPSKVTADDVVGAYDAET